MRWASDGGGGVRWRANQRSDGILIRFELQGKNTKIDSHLVDDWYNFISQLLCLICSCLTLNGVAQPRCSSIHGTGSEHCSIVKSALHVLVLVPAHPKNTIGNV